MKAHKKKRDLFNILFTGAFIVYVIIGMLIIGLDNISDWFDDLELWEAFILALATQRLVRLFVYDGITEFFRDFFLDITIHKDGTIDRKKFDSGIKRSVSDILLCPWCFSVWASVSLVFMVLLFPAIGYFVAAVLAISTASSILQISGNAIGWNAENGKLNASKKQ